MDVADTTSARSPSSSASAGSSPGWVDVARRGQLPLFAAADSLLGDDLRTRDVRAGRGHGSRGAFFDSRPADARGARLEVVRGLSTVALTGMILSGAWPRWALARSTSSTQRIRSTHRHVFSFIRIAPAAGAHDEPSPVRRHASDADTAQRGEHVFVHRPHHPGNYRELYATERRRRQAGPLRMVVAREAH